MLGHATWKQATGKQATGKQATGKQATGKQVTRKQVTWKQVTWGVSLTCQVLAKSWHLVCGDRRPAPGDLSGQATLDQLHMTEQWRSAPRSPQLRTIA
jgi:hypothetical protein